MTNLKTIKAIGYTCFVVLFFTLAACEKELPPPPDNPFDTPTIDAPVDTTEQTTTELDPNSLTAIHADIFIPTCANSGCHDGTFEPDFRTIGSTYNTLVGKDAIQLDPDNESIIHRVEPFNASSSMLFHRLNTFIPNTSGIMPLESNDSDWDENEEAYKARIQAWINNGAPNVFD